MINKPLTQQLFEENTVLKGKVDNCVCLIERLQEQLDIVTEQRNDIHIDKQVLQEQLNEANKALKDVCMHCETEQFECRCGWVEPCKDCNAHYSARDYLKKWGVK